MKPPAVFAPSALSISQINTNFMMFKTPSATSARTPFKVGQSVKAVVPSVKENRLTPRQTVAGETSLLSASSELRHVCVNLFLYVLLINALKTS